MNHIDRQAQGFSLALRGVDHGQYRRGAQHGLCHDDFCGKRGRH
ncbi:MAG: hypothetical protein V7772_18145 [Pseudomonas profundi]|jgi:hypothetical protein|nr:MULTISPECIES: hypothetical protein [Pseudomonadota]MEB3734014.1 hypothetical protein [Halopseudomonas pachastrellae]WDA39526.1 hypothetical protein PO876_26925 [Sphingobium sp. YC-XJ3]|tara:strand:- start:1568 stop:1699 length:132 start_codon:yes stop_codon:yes gene_type:complete